MRVRLFDDNTEESQIVKVLREVHTMALLSHPNVVRYYSAWCELASVADDDHAAAAHATYDERYRQQRGVKYVQGQRFTVSKVSSTVTRAALSMTMLC